MRRMNGFRWDDGDSGRLPSGQRFRLDRVRAPESYQFGGTRAKQRAVRQTFPSMGPFQTKVVGVDAYGRKIIRLSNKRGSVNQRMLRFGYRNKGR